MSGRPFAPPLAPMEAKVRDDLPPAPGWAYEPKWDGFRAVAWAAAGSHGAPPVADAGDDAAGIRLDSRNAKDLLRYFPELRPALEALPAGAVVDGEVVVVHGGRLDFDALSERIHPADSRIRTLAAQTPAALVAFDLLALDGEDLRPLPYAQRRARLAELVPALPAPWHLTPTTTDPDEAARWFTEFESAGCDGIVAKRIDGRYVDGKREMVKVKHRRDADVVVGGYRVHKDGGKVGSLLLGLHDERGQLHFIGHCSGFGDADRRALLERLEPLRVHDSFGEDVRRPGEPSRWTGDKDLSWVPVRTELVCQVSYDQLTGDRFRHATRFERWRPDKDPAECTLAQLERPEGPDFAEVVAS